MATKKSRFELVATSETLTRPITGRDQVKPRSCVTGSLVPPSAGAPVIVEVEPSSRSSQRMRGKGAVHPDGGEELEGSKLATMHSGTPMWPPVSVEVMWLA